MKSYHPALVVGMDVGDRFGQLCCLDRASGEVIEDRVSMTIPAVREHFRRLRPQLVALEVGTHSPWLSRTLRELGIPTLVANARRLHLISRSDSKNDRADAELLARLAAADPALLSPIEHRGEVAQAGLAVLKSRDALVRSRVSKISQVRGVAKSFGVRLPRSSSVSFARQVRDQIPAGLQSALHPLLDSIESDTTLIKDLDREIRRLAEEEFPETRHLRQVNGVGVLTSLAFVLVLEDPRRFVNSRAVGAYLGLRPRQHESGTIHRQLHITKAGDSFLRVLLVQCAQYILGPFGEDCDLRRWGLARAQRGGRHAKRRAVVAVARKLATVLHRLWMDEASYEPLRRGGKMAA